MKESIPLFFVAFWVGSRALIGAGNGSCEKYLRNDFQPVLQIQNFFVPLRTRKVRETDYNKLNYT